MFPSHLNYNENILSEIALDKQQLFIQTRDFFIDLQ